MAPDLAGAAKGIRTPTYPRPVGETTVSDHSVVAWIVCATARLRPSRSRTLADPVAAAIHVERPNLATVRRRMAGPITSRGAINRLWRSTDNHRVEVADAMAGVIDLLMRRRKKRLVLSLDWTEVRDFHTLIAAACIGGRAVPRLSPSYPEWRLTLSQNALEEGPRARCGRWSRRPSRWCWPIAASAGPSGSRPARG
jgi:hypothetical protein